MAAKRSGIDQFDALIVDEGQDVLSIERVFQSSIIRSKAGWNWGGGAFFMISTISRGFAVATFQTPMNI